MCRRNTTTTERPRASAAQEDFADQKASEYGTSRVTVLNTGTAVIDALTDDIVRERWLVWRDGDAVREF